MFASPMNAWVKFYFISNEATSHFEIRKSIQSSPMDESSLTKQNGPNISGFQLRILN